MKLFMATGTQSNYNNHNIDTFPWLYGLEDLRGGLLRDWVVDLLIYADVEDGGNK